MTIELNYKKGQAVDPNSLVEDIKRQLSALFEKKSLEQYPGWYDFVAKDDIDIKVTITINHESFTSL